MTVDGSRVRTHGERCVRSFPGAAESPRAVCRRPAGPARWTRLRADGADRISSEALRADRNRMGDAAHGRMAGRVRTPDRQFACGARLPFRRAVMPSIGVTLTAAAVPLWFQPSAVEECHNRVEQALAA